MRSFILMVGDGRGTHVGSGKKVSSAGHFSGLEQIPLPAFVLRPDTAQPLRSLNTLAHRRLAKDPDLVERIVAGLRSHATLPPTLDVSDLDVSPDGRLVLVVDRGDFDALEREFSDSFGLPLHLGRVGSRVLLGREKHQIAEELGTTEKTIGFYVHGLLRGSGHVSRLDLAARQPHWGIRFRVAEALVVKVGGK